MKGQKSLKRNSKHGGEHMNITWRKYLIITGILCLFLGMLIPITIDYITFYDVIISSPNHGIEVGWRGLYWTIFKVFLFWFFISYSTFVIFKLVMTLFAKNVKILK